MAVFVLRLLIFWQDSIKTVTTSKILIVHYSHLLDDIVHWTCTHDLNLLCFESLHSASSLSLPTSSFSEWDQTLLTWLITAMSNRPVEQALGTLLPTHADDLPSELVQLATSLVAQSRSFSSSLKPEEEIARPYACAEIACKRYVYPPVTFGGMEQLTWNESLTITTVKAEPCAEIASAAWSPSMSSAGLQEALRISR